MITFIETIKPREKLIYDLVRIAIEKSCIAFVDYSLPGIPDKDIGRFQQLSSDERLNYLRNMTVSYIVLYDDPTDPAAQYLEHTIPFSVIKTHINIDTGVMRPIIIGTTNYAILHHVMFNSGLGVPDIIKSWIRAMPYSTLICLPESKTCPLCDNVWPVNKFHNIEIACDGVSKTLRGNIDICPACLSRIDDKAERSQKQRHSTSYRSGY